MKRREFIKRSGLALGALILPLNFYSFAEEFSLDDLVGKSNPKLFGNGYQLREKAYLDFEKMSSAARKDGIKLYAASSYRSFNHQKRIWNNKYVKYIKQGLSPEKAIEKIVLYSTIPGTSRHHWGTDIDVIDLNKKTPNNPLNAEHFHGTGVYAPLKTWLNKNAENFGFYEVYTNKKDRKGFAYEPWHLSYRPTSCVMFSQYLSLNFSSLINSLDIKGKEHFSNKFLEKYYQENIQDINIDLLP